MSFRSTSYKVNGLALVSILASHLSRASLRDVWYLNRLIVKVRDLASRPIIIWPYDPEAMSFISMSDIGGVGGGEAPLEDDGRTHDAIQGAWVFVTSGEPLQPGRASRVSLLSWRSTKLKRRVPSSLAGEALNLSAAVAEVEWLQCMYLDMMFAGLRCPDWWRSMSPFGVVLRSRCTLGARQSQRHVKDAMSTFDMLQEDAIGSRQDRRTALELAIIAEALRAADAPLLGGCPTRACPRTLSPRRIARRSTRRWTI